MDGWISKRENEFMSNRILGLSIDANHAAAVAAFWAKALGCKVDPGANDRYATVTIDDSDHALMPRLVFHQVPEGKTVKNRLHLDLVVGDWEEEIARLIGLGATRVRDIEEGGARWTTLTDPEGNEFDLVRG
jgi:hypothetical protein